MLNPTQMIRDLRALASSPAGREKVKQAVRKHGLAGGVAWEQMDPRDIAHVHLECFGVHEELPGPSTPDDSPEGRALNSHLDDIKF